MIDSRALRIAMLPGVPLFIFSVTRRLGGREAAPDGSCKKACRADVRLGARTVQQALSYKHAKRHQVVAGRTVQPMDLRAFGLDGIPGYTCLIERFAPTTATNTIILAFLLIPTKYYCIRTNVR